MNIMKKFLLMLTMIFLIPVTVFAASKEKINVYIFKGEGCGYCAKALTFFEGLDDEYQNYFNLIEKEVWNDKDNAAQMQEVAAHFDEEVNGVPYIIIGDKTFQGFSAEYEEDIKKVIKDSYENKDDSYQDVVASVLKGDAISSSKGEKKDNGAAITIIVLAAIVAGIGFLIYMARDDSVEVVEEKKISNTNKNNNKKNSKKK